MAQRAETEESQTESAVDTTHEHSPAKREVLEDILQRRSQTLTQTLEFMQFERVLITLEFQIFCVFYVLIAQSDRCAEIHRVASIAYQ